LVDQHRHNFRRNWQRISEMPTVFTQRLATNLTKHQPNDAKKDRREHVSQEVRAQSDSDESIHEYQQHHNGNGEQPHMARLQQRQNKKQQLAIKQRGSNRVAAGKTVARPIDKRTLDEWPLVAEIFLDKISFVRYIAFTFFVRYVGIRSPYDMRTTQKISVGIFLLAAISALAGAPTFEVQPSPDPTDGNSHNLFSYETTYTFDSDFEESKLGHGSSLYDDFSFDHRFHITGKVYFRAGVEYERYDFGGSDNGLPDHLQGLYGHLALEYVVKDYPGAAIELDPGVYFQDRISGNAFDLPGKAYVSFPLKKDKIFATVGLGWGQFQEPVVAPGGGITWLINDKLRLQAVFPKPALVYQPNDDWDIRAIGELNFIGARTDDVVTTERKLQVHNAVVQYSEYRAGLQIGFSGFKPFKIIAGAGATIQRNYDFFRINQSKRTDPAPYIRIAAEAKF
jgi:Domain of unknown function (DUF6268)